MHRLHSLALSAVLATLVLATSPAAAATLTRQPYLQRVGTDTATVAFRLDTPCVPWVLYGTAGLIDQSAASTISGRTHAIVLTGLTPGTEYTYMVEACGARTAPVRFSTAPVPGTRQVHFAAVGDFGSNNNDQREVANAILARKPELFLALGDNAYEAGTEAEFQNNLFVPMAPLLAQVPFFAVPGNHEYVTRQGQPYFDNLYLPTSRSGGEHYYSFDWGFVHFVALDSNCAIGLSSADQCTLAEQKKWVEEDLAGSNAPWKVALFHHPPWSSGEHGSQLLMRREFSPLFEKYGVDLVLTGHDHDYERSKPMKGNAEAPYGTAAPTYLVVGSGGATLRPLGESQKPSWSALRNNAAHGYLDVVVRDGTLSAQLLTPLGRVVDSFTLQKDLPPELSQPPESPPPDTGTPAPPQENGQPDTSQPTPTPPPSTGTTPEPPRDSGAPEELAPPEVGCSVGSMSVLLPMGVWVFAGVLRRRRHRR